MAGLPIRQRGAPLQRSQAGRRVVSILESFLYIVWLGSLVGIALVAAPAAFGHARAQDAGAIVGASLHTLTYVTWVCGGIALLIWLARIPSEGRTALVGALLVALAIAANDYVQGSIIPPMNAIVADVHGPVASLPKADPRRQTFDRLHRRSTQAYSLVLIFGFAAAALAAVRRER